jgi:hypothetical protein
MFNILSQKANANQNDIEMPSHPSQNGYDEKTNAGKDAKGNQNIYTLLVGR